MLLFDTLSLTIVPRCCTDTVLLLDTLSPTIVSRCCADAVLLFDTLSPTRFEKYWPNPNEFDTSRFDRSNPKFRKNVACLNTFGGGRR